jgi:putative ABC transport system permease protein
MENGRWFYKLRLRFRTVFQRSQVERELDEELRFHIDQRVEQEIARGLTPEAAHYVAVRAMEGIEQKKEECRDMRRLNFIETLLQDLRYAVRSFGKSPGFTAVAILTLTLGIGASLAILTVVNSVLLRPLPFPDADRLVVLFATSPNRGVYQDSTSFPDFLDWKTQSQAFAGVAAFRRDPFSVTGGGAPARVTGLHASYELFQVLGVSPVIGRAFNEQEQHGKSAVVIISHGLWMRRFAGDPNILGKTILINEAIHSVIGVLPQGFQFPSFTDTDVIVPIPENANRSTGYLLAIARMKPRARTATAQQELDAIAGRLEQAFPYTNRGRGVNVVPLGRVAVGDARTPLLMLMGAALFVLLIGCANAGNLALARGIARGRELAVRSTLGAGAGRLVRQVLTESAALTLAAALLGAALAFWGSELLAASLSRSFALPGVTFDWTLLALAVLIALLAGVVCGLPPALMVRRSDLNDFLKQGSRGQSVGRTQHRLQSLLVISETALTIVLLVGAGLLLKSFVLLQQTNSGLDPHNVLTADLLLSKRYADVTRREAFLRELVESLEGLPGVQHAGVLTDPPFNGGSHETFKVEGAPDPGPGHGHVAALNVVSSGVFRAMGIPIKRGRGFDQRDSPVGSPVVVVNQTMARQFWPDQDPVGKRIRFYYDKDPERWLSIVGVVGDVRDRGLHLDPVPEVFVPYQQSPYRFLPYPQAPFVSLVVRTAADPARLIAAVQARIWAVDKDQPVLNIQTMEQVLSHTVASRRVYLLLLGSFAAIALVMATAGIYGLISYAVARRTHEMGIRVALGATVGQILAMVLRRGMLLSSIGVGIGIAGSLAVTRVMSGLLYGITATDAPTFIAMALLFAVVAFVATYIPARRAATIDPTVAFRHE